MAKEDLDGKPDNIKEKIVEGGRRCRMIFNIDMFSILTASEPALHIFIFFSDCRVASRKV
jgi:hypothetical protein